MTSKTCPACGALRRERVGEMFQCECGWSMDRQHNAGLNILKTALASNEVLARGVRFQPGALRHDMVIPLYDLARGARDEPSGVIGYGWTIASAEKVTEPWNDKMEKREGATIPS